MAASLLRIGRLNCIRCLQAGNWGTLSKAPLAVPFSSKSGGSKKWSQKNPSGKKQPKTYFDIEKLVQHKPCEVFPAPVAAVKPAEQCLPSAAVPESVATISAVKDGGQVVETSPSSQAIPDPASTAEVTPAVEMPPSGEAPFESAIVAEAVPVVPAEATATDTATVTEAIPVVESMAEAVTAPTKDFAESIVPVTEAGAVVAKSPVEAATEVSIEMPLEAKPFETEPLFKASSVDMVPKIAENDAPVDVSQDPVAKFAHTDVAPEPASDTLPVDETMKPAVEAVPVSVAQEAVTDTVPVAEAASVEVATSPIEAEVFPTPEAAAEVSVPVEIAENLVDQSPVTAKAAGDEVQVKVQAEPADLSEDTRYTVFESAIEAADVPVVPSEATATVTEAIPVVESVVEAVAGPAEDLAESTATEAGTLIVKSVEAATEAPVEVPVESIQFVETAPEFVCVEAVDEALVKASLVDMAPEPATKGVPVDVSLEPAAEALPVDHALEPVVEAVPVNIAQEAATEAAPVVETFEPLTEAGPVEVATEETGPVEVATEEAEVFLAPEGADEISVPVEIAEKLMDQPPVIAVAAGGEQQEKDPADPTEISEAHIDPIQKLFLDSIREYSSKTQATGGLVNAGSEYEKALAEEITKLARLYGGGDLTSFPEFKFEEPNLDEVRQK